MPSVGAVTSNLNVVTKTANYTAAANDFVLADATSGAITITLPNAPVINTVVAVKKTDNTTSAVSIVPGGTANLNGDTSAVLAVTGAAATFQYDGTNWQLLSTGTINTANPAAGLPTGGATDQVLKKNSATNYDVSWTTMSAGGGGPIYPWQASRAFFASPLVGAVTSQVSSYWSSSPCAYPVRVPNACTISNVSVVCNTTGATGSIYVSVYADTASTVSSGGPTTRLGGGSGSFNTLAWNPFGVNMNVTFTQATNVWFLFSMTNNSLNLLCNTGVGMQGMLMGGASGMYSILSVPSTRIYSVSTTSHPADLTNTTGTLKSEAVPVFIVSVS